MGDQPGHELATEQRTRPVLTLKVFTFWTQRQLKGTRALCSSISSLFWRNLVFKIILGRAGRSQPTASGEAQVLLGRPGWDHLEREETGSQRGSCVCVHARPRVHACMPPFFLLGGAYPFSSHQLPSRRSLLLDPSLTRVQQARGWAGGLAALLSSAEAS